MVGDRIFQILPWISLVVYPNYVNNLIWKKTFMYHCRITIFFQYFSWHLWPIGYVSKVTFLPIWPRHLHNVTRIHGHQRRFATPFNTSAEKVHTLEILWNCYIVRWIDVGNLSTQHEFMALVRPPNDDWLFTAAWRILADAPTAYVAHLPVITARQPPVARILSFFWWPYLLVCNPE